MEPKPGTGGVMIVCDKCKKELNRDDLRIRALNGLEVMLCVLCDLGMARLVYDWLKEPAKL
jgi:hypothetical protein